jgi:quinolinate synthase
LCWPCWCLPHLLMLLQDVQPPQARLHESDDQLASIGDPRERLAEIVRLGRTLPHLPAAERRPENQVMGCTAQVWLTVSWASDQTVAIAAHSDSSISRGLAAVLIRAFSGLSPEDIDAFKVEDLDQLAVGPALGASSRTNAFRNMFLALQKRTRTLRGEYASFPSLLITADSLEPQGAFAEAQARFLQPSTSQVDRLARVLESKKIGVVAHFYMDPEVQGVLTSAATQWPHIAISGACWIRCLHSCG